MSALSAKEQQLNAYRNQLNQRAVMRADPAVQQIINTSLFNVLYIFDSARGEWDKAKMEGPMFLVKRNTEPEHALYLLNRSTAKNMLLPLIPGEIRVTPMEDSMLIVEKRGEGVKRGLHFSEGRAVVEEFRDSIIHICGDPRAKTVSADGKPAPSPSPFPAPAAATTSTSEAVHSTPAPDDDFQRLFGNLLKTSNGPLSTHHVDPAIAPPQSTTTYTQTHTYQTTAPPPPPPPAATRPPPRPDTPPSPPITFSDPIVSPPLAVPAQAPLARSPVPQTADDLLNSILGVSPLPPRNAPMQPPFNATSAPVPPQALRTPPPPPLPQHPPPVPALSPRPVPSPMSAQRARDRPPHLDHTPSDSPAPDAMLNGNPLLDHRGPLADAITQSLPVNFRAGSGAPDPRLAFKLDLLDLIQRDPGFVDHLFNAFQARRSAGS